MIKSFADSITEKLFLDEPLTKKESKAIGSLNRDKIYKRLRTLDIADEKLLLTTPAFSYHSLSGDPRYSIDAESRRSKWRITFRWEDEEKTDVRLVKLEDTH